MLIRIALYGNPFELDHVRVAEHLASDLENESGLIERSTLFGQWQGEAVASEFQNVHRAFRLFCYLLNEPGGYSLLSGIAFVAFQKQK